MQWQKHPKQLVQHNWTVYDVRFLSLRLSHCGVGENRAKFKLQTNWEWNVKNLTFAIVNLKINDINWHNNKSSREQTIFIILR